MARHTHAKRAPIVPLCIQSIPLPVDGVDGLAGVRFESERYEPEAARVFRPGFRVRAFDEVDAFDRAAVREHGLDVLGTLESRGGACRGHRKR